MAPVDIDRGKFPPSPLYSADSVSGRHASALPAKAGRACALPTKAGFGAQPRLLSKLRNSFCASHG